jgi:peroxiredoxin
MGSAASRRRGARALGIGVNSSSLRRAWAERRVAIECPLLSHFKREVVGEYGVKHGAGFPERT